MSIYIIFIIFIIFIDIYPTYLFHPLLIV